MLAPDWEGNTLEVEAGGSGVQGFLWLRREGEASKNLKANGKEGKTKPRVALSSQQQLCKLVLTGFLYPAKLLIKGGLPHSNLENKRQRSNAYKILNKNNSL